MRKLLFIGLCLFILGSCQKTDAPTEYVIEPHDYPVLDVVSFLDSLYFIHQNHFRPIHQKRFEEICESQNIKTTDSLNQSKLFPLLFYHELFTLNISANCARSQILDIAYFWHWLTPNPRHSILSIRDNKTLNELPSLPEKPLYQTYGDMDRTPAVYLKDLFEQPRNFYAVGCDTFSTFGWCSETEMSFVLLMEQLGYIGNVELSEGGNHSWSSFQMDLTLNDGTVEHFEVEVDNTFDEVRVASFVQRPTSSILKMEKWYDEQSRYSKEIEAVKKIQVSKATSAKIERDIIEFLK
jgi:hypothetical protein